MAGPYLPDNITPERALGALIPILNRAPVHSAEQFGAQLCIGVLNEALKELAALKEAALDAQKVAYKP